MTEIDALVDTERRALLAVLEGLTDEQWRTPSLCAGWSVRELVVHLLMPYELSVAPFLLRMAAARFRFDVLADRWARRDTRSPRQLLDALRASADRRFNVPGAPAEAPLSHLVIHVEDVYRPLGVSDRPGTRSRLIVLDQLTGPRAASLTAGLPGGLALSADDVVWSSGTGAPVVGSAAALITTLAGRSAALDELSGDGVALVRERLAARSRQPDAARTSRAPDR